MPRMTFTSLAIGIACLLGASAAMAQETTERYIPVGQSPGLSNQYTYMGAIESIDAENQTVTVDDAGQTRAITILPRTRIWLDRTEQQRANEGGTFLDLQPGQTIEIKYTDYESKDAADWIKVVTNGI